jgi:hypothetical protein
VLCKKLICQCTHCHQNAFYHLMASSAYQWTTDPCRNLLRFQQIAIAFYLTLHKFLLSKLSDNFVGKGNTTKRYSTMPSAHILATWRWAPILVHLPQSLSSEQSY